MAKGTVKGINTGMQGGTSTVGVTVTQSGGSQVGPTGFGQPSSNPPGQIMIGTIEDASNPQLSVNFSQAFGAELGLVAGVKVNYNTVTVGGQVIANCVRLLQRGEILTINADDTTGTLKDRALGTTIPFAPPLTLIPVTTLVVET